MLGTINYEQSQFKASIVSFKKALHIDPYFTDSSIGLSVVLNDLGKYEQAKEIFQDAQKKLKEQNTEQSGTNLNLEIANKHRELSELYSKANQPRMAFQNIVQYEELTAETLETVLMKAKLQRTLSNFSFAVEILKSWHVENPGLNQPAFFLALSELYYLDRKVVSALEICQLGLKLDPQNSDLIKLYSNLTNTEFDLRPKEI
jgi:tetratricopeptide (TPR) repeat protein